MTPADMTEAEIARMLDAQAATLRAQKRRAYDLIHNPERLDPPELQKAIAHVRRWAGTPEGRKKIASVQSGWSAFEPPEKPERMGRETPEMTKRLRARAERHAKYGLRAKRVSRPVSRPEPAEFTPVAEKPQDGKGDAPWRRHRRGYLSKP